MRFHFNTWNHCREGQIIIEDITRIMGGQIDALGHRATYNNSTFIKRDDGYNVILESFADNPATIASIKAAHFSGSRFIIVATEEPTPKGFNSGLEPAMIDRQIAFPAAAQYADGILHLIPGDHINGWYSQFAPAAHADLGAYTMLPVSPVAPDYEFGFYGKMTWRREMMLGKLGKIGRVLLLHSLDMPRRERDVFMRRAKVIVQIRANEEWGMVSSSRCASALMLGRAVIAEPHPSPAPWNKVIRFAPTVEAFYDVANKTMLRWRTEYREQYQRFVETMTPARCIGDPLRKIGVLK